MATISQRDHHASVLNDGQMVFLDQLWCNKAVDYTNILQNYNNKRVGYLPLKQVD